MSDSSKGTETAIGGKLAALRVVRFAGASDAYVLLQEAIPRLRAAGLDLDQWPHIYRRATETTDSRPQLATATQHRQYHERIRGGEPLPERDHPGDIGDQIVRVHEGLPPEPIELLVLASALDNVLGGALRRPPRPAWHDDLEAIRRENPDIQGPAAWARMCELPSYDHDDTKLLLPDQSEVTRGTFDNVLSRLRKDAAALR